MIRMLLRLEEGVMEGVVKGLQLVIKFVFSWRSMSSRLYRKGMEAGTMTWLR